MEAAAFHQVRDAWLPERRAIQDRDVRVRRLVLDDRLELAADGRSRHDAGWIDGPRLQRLPCARRQRAVEGVARLAGAVLQVRQRCTEPVEHAVPASFPREGQTFARRAEKDLLDVRGGTRLKLAPRVSLAFAEIERPPFAAAASGRPDEKHRDIPAE